MTYMCPVCRYNQMQDPPKDFNICPCCGTEFGYEDSGRTLKEVRENWLKRGAPWFSPEEDKPPGWNPIQQLLNAGMEYSQITGRIRKKEVKVRILKQGVGFPEYRLLDTSDEEVTEAIAV